MEGNEMSSASRVMLKAYVSQKLNDEQAKKFREYLRKVGNVAFDLTHESLVLDPRYRAQALTKLEEASMFISKAISHAKV